MLIQGLPKAQKKKKKKLNRIGGRRPLLCGITPINIGRNRWHYAELGRSLG
jgi:hypothetical protein